MARPKKPTKLRKEWYSAYERVISTGDEYDDDVIGIPEKGRPVLHSRGHIRGEIELAYDTEDREFVATLVATGESRRGKTEEEALTEARVYMFERSTVETSRILEITWKCAPDGIVGCTMNKDGLEQTNWTRQEFNWQVKEKERAIDPTHPGDSRYYVARYRCLDSETMNPVTRWSRWEHKGTQREGDEFELPWSPALQAFCHEMTSRFQRLGQRITAMLGPTRDIDKLKEIGTTVLKGLLPGESLE